MQRWHYPLVEKTAPDPGLCASCVHARVIGGARSAFWLCELSRTDPRFPRYPRLPVLRCDGYSPDGGSAISRAARP
jgi:hypothetical protein